MRCSFHILCQNEPISNTSKFSKWPPFWGSGALLNRKLYRNLSYTPFPSFWDFVRRSSLNINGVMAISKFDLLFDLVTYLCDLCPTKAIGFCVVADYICGPSLVMIGQKLRPVSQKMWQFHLNMNIEGTLWRHAVTSLVTSSLWKSFWWMIYILSFYTCCQIEAILKTAKFFKLTKIWGPGELFHHKCHRKYVILTG